MPTKPRPSFGHRKAEQYRIRWAVVSRGDGRRLSSERMCIAERRTRWFGWWPARDAEWRFNEAEAEADIAKDRAIRAPLPAHRYIA